MGFEFFTVQSLQPSLGTHDPGKTALPIGEILYDTLTVEI